MRVAIFLNLFLRKINREFEKNFGEDMLGEETHPYGFQTFYNSREQSRCPLIPEIVRIYQDFIDKNILDDESYAVISIRYGKRILINGSNNSKFSEIENFLEVVDYDPVKNIVLVIGPALPYRETPIHCLIQNARRGVNSIIQINSKKIFEKLNCNIQNQIEEKNNYLEYAKDILTILRENNFVMIKDKGIIVVGKNIFDSKQNLFSILKV